MKIQELIRRLKHLRGKHGNLPVAGASGWELQEGDIRLLTKTTPRIDHENRTVSIYPEICAVKIGRIAEPPRKEES